MVTVTNWCAANASRKTHFGRKGGGTRRAKARGERRDCIARQQASLKLTFAYQARKVPMARRTATGSSSNLTVAGQPPTISREEEHELAKRWTQHGDTSARDLLVRSQLRNVVAMA